MVCRIIIYLIQKNRLNDINNTYSVVDKRNGKRRYWQKKRKRLFVVLAFIQLNQNTMELIKCLIIGSGPAGYTAAIYAARADLKPVVYTGMEPGGQLTTTTEVDNFPGYPKGVDGPSMMVELQQQAERFGTEVRIGHVTEVNLSKVEGGIHTVVVDGTTTIEAETIIISTGASAKYLGLPSEQRLRGGGVSACAVCDGFFYKGQEVAIVGAGDTAAEEATYLANICTKVTMLVRRDVMRAQRQCNTA